MAACLPNDCAAAQSFLTALFQKAIAGNSQVREVMVSLATKKLSPHAVALLANRLVEQIIDGFGKEMIELLVRTSECDPAVFGSNQKFQRKSFAQALRCGIEVLRVAACIVMKGGTVAGLGDLFEAIAETADDHSWSGLVGILNKRDWVKPPPELVDGLPDLAHSALLIFPLDQSQKHDREERCTGADEVHWQFHEFRTYYGISVKEPES
jgi:hypothetical protein